MKTTLFIAGLLLINQVAFAQISINEIVTDPQLDWSSNHFNGISDDGPITISDEYIELYVYEFGVNLTNWTIEVNDGISLITTFGDRSIFDHFKYHSAANNGRLDSTAIGDFIVLGNLTGSASMNNSTTIVVRNPEGTLIDSIALNSSDWPSGNASAYTNESLSAIPDGSQNRIKTVGSPGRTNSKIGTVLVNEIVVNPLSDWSSSNYQATVLNTTAGLNDEWLELWIGQDGLNLNGWTLALIDGTDVEGDLTHQGAFSRMAYYGSGNFHDTKAGDLLILANVQGSGQMNNSGDIILRHPSGQVIDSVSFGKGLNPSGKGSFSHNESLVRIHPDSVLFVRSFATPGKNNADSISVWTVINGDPGWYFVSAPVQNQIVNTLKGDVPTSGFIGSDFPDLAFNNVKFYQETVELESTGHRPVTSISDALQSGVGFQLYIGLTPDTIKWTGPPLKTGFDYSISPGEPSPSEFGWNLLGNPYPDAIDWDSPNFEKDGIEDAYYVWDGTNQQYATYAYGIGLNGGSSSIAAGQAFWIKSNSTNPQVSISPDAMLSNDAEFFKTEPQGLLVSATSGGVTDQAFISNQQLPALVPKMKGNSLFSLAIKEQSSLYSITNADLRQIANLEITAQDFPIQIQVESFTSKCTMELTGPSESEIQSNGHNTWVINAENMVINVQLSWNCGTLVTSVDPTESPLPLKGKSNIHNVLGQRVPE